MQRQIREDEIGSHQSSLRMVPRPAVSPRTAFVGDDRFTPNVSSFSSAVSPVTGTVNVFAVCPGLNVSVVLVAV